jgi:hypothetical protein
MDKFRKKFLKGDFVEYKMGYEIYKVKFED